MFGDDPRVRFRFPTYCSHKALLGGGILVDGRALLGVIQEPEPVTAWRCEGLRRVRLRVG